jgi:hypothetical protein
MPADDGIGLDKGKVTTPIGENLGENGPKCPIRWPESRSLGCPLKHIELMAKGEVFQASCLRDLRAAFNARKMILNIPTY